MRAAFAGCLLVAPDALLGRGADRRARSFARVLGARHLVELLAIGARPAPGRTALGGAVDAVHAATMIVVAMRLPGRRRLALANAGTAVTLAAASFLEATRARRGGRH